MRVLIISPEAGFNASCFSSTSLAKDSTAIAVLASANSNGNCSANFLGSYPGWDVSSKNCSLSCALGVHINVSAIDRLAASWVSKLAAIA